MNKEQKIKLLEEKLKKIIEQSIKNKNYEKAMAAIAACAQILYIWNQKYIDLDLEKKIEYLAKVLIPLKINKNMINKNVILFYDNVGEDTRGLSCIYLKALVNLGFKIIYLVSDKKEKKQPEISKILNKDNVICETFSEKKYIKKMLDINSIFYKYKPEIAFFYSTNNDIAGAVVFKAYENIVRRFQINLTDHGYWLGSSMILDYCIEFRDYGAYISNKYRKIEKEKLIKLPFYPYFNKELSFKGFPFDAKNKKIIFSGGSLYKTLGDKDNTYYKIINNILSKHLDVIFLYAGSGKSDELNKLLKLYPNRVYQIAERKDLYQLMTHVTLYLNTYPILGGLMTQYAAIANKIPITLMRKNDVFDGFLVKQQERKIEYTNVDELLKDVDKLLEDEHYRHLRERNLIGSIISEEDFKNAVYDIISKNNTKYDILYKEYHVKEFLKGYVDRADYNDIAFASVAKNSNIILLNNFLDLFIKKNFYKLFKASKKIIEKLRS
mgnify:CR=1 FL=1